MVDMRIVFDAGAARDENNPGLSILANGLLAEGAGGLTANELAERFESIGARFGNSAHRDMATLTLRTLSDKKIFDKAVANITTILTMPDFPKVSFERERSRLLTTLKRHKQSPDSQADEAFFGAVYEGHPYRFLPTGTEEGINGLTINKLKNFYNRYYVGRNAVVAIVGDIKRQAAEKLAEITVGLLPAGQSAGDLPAVAALKDGKEIGTYLYRKQMIWAQM